MTVFRVIWAVMFTAILIYTGRVISLHGMGFINPFFGAIHAGGWQGQFNADFLGMLILSACWTGWRNGWGVKGGVLALLALSFGAPFLCCYMLFLSFQSNANARQMLLGVHDKRDFS